MNDLRGKRAMRSVMLFCAFVGATLGLTVFLGEDTVAAEPREVAQAETAREQPRLRLAQATGAGRKAGYAAGGKEKLSKLSGGHDYPFE